MNNVLFFGCLRGAYGDDQAGHFLYGMQDGWPRTLPLETQPWGKAIDSDIEGVPLYVLSEEDGWVCIDFRDRSGDSRPGSHSAFLCKHAGEISANELLKLAREQWPGIFNRPGFREDIKEMAQ